jgi:uncharacterized protein (TIGR00296 family)
MDLTLKQGADVVSFARKVIELHFEGLQAPEPKSLEDVFKENRGVFVTLDTYPGRELRGCIGYPEPVMQLGRALRESALSAAFGDLRFPHLAREELPGIVVEVSVLTPPEKITVDKPVDYPKHVKVGRDGLIIRKGWTSGLLLPQVAVEHGWDEEEFLSHTCVKAGLTPDEWLAPGAKIFKFSAQIFSEETPKGKVTEKKLDEKS